MPQGLDRVQSGRPPGRGDAEDEADADELYHILEEKVIPLYYERDRNGVPHGWVRIIKQTIRSNAPLFSARRMVKEYTEQMYLNAAQASDIIQKEVTQLHHARKDHAAETVLPVPDASPSSV